MNKNIGRFLLDSMMLALFMSLLALPVAGFGLFSVKNQNEVLGVHTSQSTTTSSKAVSGEKQDYKTVIDDYVIKQYQVRSSNSEPLSSSSSQVNSDVKNIENSESETLQSTPSQDLPGN